MAVNNSRQGTLPCSRDYFGLVSKANVLLIKRTPSVFKDTDRGKIFKRLVNIPILELHFTTFHFFLVMDTGDFRIRSIRAFPKMNKKIIFKIIRVFKISIKKWNGKNKPKEARFFDQHLHK